MDKDQFEEKYKIWEKRYLEYIDSIDLTVLSEDKTARITKQVRQMWDEVFDEHN